MTTRQTNAILVRRLELVLAAYPAARAAHLARIAEADGHATTTRGAAPPTLTGHRDDPDADVTLTRVEQAADQRARAIAHLDGLDRALRLIRDDIDLLAALCDRALRGAPQAKPAECSGLGRDGNLEWWDPTCRDAATKDGLCGKHYHAERRWRDANGLPTRKSIQPARETA